jgi:DMSO/TMAO reductase YedYZ heme-binding membrane subunit
MSIRRYLTVAYLKWVFWILVSLRWVSIVVESTGEDGFAWRTAVLETGDLAWVLLIFTIFISLLHKLFPRFWLFCNLLPLRKHTGIFAFLIAVSHGVFQFLRMGIASDVPAMIKTAFSTEDAMVLGSVSVLIMLPLFIMSADRIVAWMGYCAWKRFQRMAHIAFVAAGLHIGLLRWFDRGIIEWEPLILLGVYTAGYAFLFARKLVASRKTI